MYFKYGPFRHDDNDIDLVMVRSERMYSPRNSMVFDRKTLQCQGRICVSGQADIKARIQALESAYNYDPDFGDVGLFHDSGARSAHVLVAGDAINGVRCLKYEFPREEGGEYATYRSYNLVFQADYLNPDDTIYAFEESLRFQGSGGPSWELVPTFTQLPIAYINSFYTPQRVVQTGRAVGVQGWPILPGPIYPWLNEHTDRRVVQTESPQMIGIHAKLLYPISWRYEFSFIIPNSSGFPRLDYPGH
jgi:hypothetical protein